MTTTTNRIQVLTDIRGLVKRELREATEAFREASSAHAAPTPGADEVRAKYALMHATQVLLDQVDDALINESRRP